MDFIYLDNNATTQVDPRVVCAIAAELNAPAGNPSSIHHFGRTSKALLSQARSNVASFLQARSEELIFTSGGTESMNLLISGYARSRKGRIITTRIEHSCVYESIQKQGLPIDYLPVDATGAPAPSSLEEAIRPDTLAIVLSAANGETGVKIDLKEISEIADRHRIPLVLDAVAFIGKELWTPYPGISAIGFSAHKFHGPKGIGAIWSRPHFQLSPLFYGGPQEFQKRPGTENLPGILGLSEAISLLAASQASISAHLQMLRDRFEEILLGEIPDVSINGTHTRIPNVSNLAFHGVDGESLLMHLDRAHIAASHGSACSSGALEPSRVLLQMGLDYRIARSSLRFSFSRMNSLKEIEQAADRIKTIAIKLR